MKHLRLMGPKEDVISNMLHCFLTAETKKGTSCIEIIMAKQINA